MVRHFHPYSRRSLLRQAWFGGCSVAEIVWRYRLGPRKDLGPIALSWLLLGLSIGLFPFLGWWPLLLPLATAGLATAAIGYNELRNKGKTPWELVRAAPALVVYYHVRMAGYLWRAARLRLGVAPIERVSPATMARDLPKPPDGRG